MEVFPRTSSRRLDKAVEGFMVWVLRAGAGHLCWSRLEL